MNMSKISDRVTHLFPCNWSWDPCFLLGPKHRLHGR